MPLYFFKCPSCDLVHKRLLTPVESKQNIFCEVCSCKLTRTPKPPTNQTVERLDNGFMVKAIERPADAERLYKERSAKDHTKE